MELDLDGSDRLQIPREMYTEAKFSLTLVLTIVYPLLTLLGRQSASSAINLIYQPCAARAFDIVCML
jgi:hypothetical protein